MHTQELALKVLKHLRYNDHIVGTHVDLHRMPHNRLTELLKKNVAINPFVLSTWLQTQGYYMSLWLLWEYYSRILCEAMPTKVKAMKGKPHVEWVCDTFRANSETFAEYGWFVGGNALRNLIAHHATRVVSPRSKELWKQAKAVFTDLDLDPQQYVLLDHDHAIALAWKVNNFILDPAQPAP
jgi:hypothetical protein